MIYLDYAATAPLCEEARVATLKYFAASGNESVQFRGNPNSLHTPGRDAFADLENSRRVVAKSLGVRTDEIIFTSGSTEAIFIGLYGLYHAGGCNTIITSVIEHSAVKNAAKEIAGAENVVLLRPDKFGYISPDDLASALEKVKAEGGRALVALQLANSELASVQPVKKFVELARKSGALIFIDATQALGKIPLDLKGLGVDAASIASHKIGGPHGVGALYLKANTKFKSPVVGGGQESKRRGGTQNVAGVAGFAAAVKVACETVKDEETRLRALKAKLRENLRNIIDEDEALKVHPDMGFLPNVNMFLIPGLESETSIIRFDELGFAVSGGSACSSHSTKASETFTSIGLSDKDAFCLIRVSTGRYTTEDDINSFLSALKKVIKWEQ